MMAAPRSELAAALSPFRGAFFGTAMLSILINILMLTGSFFMLQVYDRVLPSRSLPTLMALVMLLVLLLVIQGGLDWIRNRILVRIGMGIDEALRQRIFDATARTWHSSGEQARGQQPLKDLDAVRSFLGSPAATVVFDLPWLPLYLAVIFAFHATLGLTALTGAIILIILTLLTEMQTRRPTVSAANLAVAQHQLAEAGRRHAETHAAMGMAERMAERWAERHRRHVAHQQRANDVIGGFGSISKVARILLQSTVLAVGAYLVIIQEATAGIIIAGAILSARAVAPIDLATTNWKTFLAARQSWRRLSDLMTKVPKEQKRMAYPPPCETLSVERASMALPGAHNYILQGIRFSIKAGQALAIVGPSGSGKSSLIKLIVGAWQPTHGKVCLDGTSLDHWPKTRLGRHLGYVPQDIGFVPNATIAENIARFDPEAQILAVIEAARAAGVHDLISALPKGYETVLSEGSEVLSVGQRQRVALARALYGDPFLVALDEPNSNLDADGEAALNQAILNIRDRGGIAIIAAHRPSALASADVVLALRHGRQISFGRKEDVLAQVLRPQSQSLSVQNVISQSE